MKTYYLRIDGRSVDAAVEETREGLRVAVRPEAARRVDLVEIVPGWYSLLVDGRSHTLGIATWRGGAAAPGGGSRRGWTLLVDGVPVGVEIGRPAGARAGASAAGGRAGQVRAPMPGLVVALHVETGASVAIGQPLIIMEAMKMQMEIRAPHAGTVRDVRVAPGQDVAGDELLVTVE